MPEMRKITARVPTDLLRRATAATGCGITETVRLGLHLVVARASARDLRRLRGTVCPDLDLAKLRRDRR